MQVLQPLQVLSVRKKVLRLRFHQMLADGVADQLTSVV
jgi:hypothetical protein